ncbi:MAG: hypothetical protein OEZ47_14685, partial [Gammaproteobacteria bacterium]|nr:hypothetical protein [Gammaproteobacteria bacterium]
EWQNYVSLPGTRRAHEMVAHGDHLYAISGYDELKETNHGVLTLNTAASTPEWIAAPTLITPRRHFSSAVIGDSIFIGTGYSNSPVAGFETIDLSANFPAWSNLTSQASIARYGSDAAVVGDSIYVVGAYYNTPLVNSVDVLDTSDHSITSSVSNPNLVMSSIRFEPEAETLHGNVYVFGGAPSDSLIWSSGEMYSPNNPDLGWRATTPMPTPRNYFAGLEIDDEFYAIGGQRAVSTNTSAVDVYNPKLEPWQDIADLPMARRDHRSVVHNGKVYVIGGQDESKNLLGSVVVYDPASDSWADLGHDLATPRFRHFAITLGDKIYVIGGLANGSSIASVEVLDLNNLSQGWIAGPDLPLGLLNTTGVVYNNMIYLIGGRDDTQTYSSILVLDPVAGAWSSKFDKGHDIVNLSVPRHRANAAIVDGLIYVIGGTVFEGGVNTTYHRTMDIIDPATNTRKVGPPMRIARATHAEALVVDGRILVIGGHGGGPRNENEEYDIASGRWSERRVQRTTRDRFSVAQVEDRVYFIGGRDKGDGVYSLSEVYTPEFETGLDKSTRYSNVTLTGVQVNERVYRPGETVSVQGNAIFVDSGACESNCIEQLWIGINGEPTAQRCLLSAGTPANSSRSGNFNTTLTAPSAPGVYQIAFSRTWQGSCVVDPTWGHFYPPTPSTILGVIRVE